MPTATLCETLQDYVAAFAYHTFHKIKSWHGFERCTRGRTIALRKAFGDGTASEKCPHAKAAKNMGQKGNSAVQTLREKVMG